jgi:hypothetical protein
LCGRRGEAFLLRDGDERRQPGQILPSHCEISFNRVYSAAALSARGALNNTAGHAP